MKYGLFADVHANKEALEAVLNALGKENVDVYVFLGDIIGYGADPAACIRMLKDLIRQHRCIYVAGNHDQAVCGLVSDDRYTRVAREAVEWTKGQITEEDKVFLASMPLIAENEVFTAVHANLENPQEWGYIFDIDDAYPNFKLLQKRICFFGHSHKPVVFISGQNVDWSLASRIVIREDTKYLVNIGSTGQPRDGNPKAAYAVYNTDTHLVEIRRIIYDIKTAQQKISNAGLPLWLGERLGLGK